MQDKRNLRGIIGSPYVFRALSIYLLSGSVLAETTSFSFSDGMSWLIDVLGYSILDALASFKEIFVIIILYIIFKRLKR